MGALPGFSLEDSKYAVESSAIITSAEIKVLIFSFLVHAKPAARLDPELPV
ncbi:unannotated protein [freshwater metagenome]|uniref:Unannotated protein n=1 Tax=freshwater metagenome TaxID=449393 RepID=A0A6J6S1D4_9ZZZZ